ncbi:MAG: type II toxin-antitoxin system RelE/ParE family toxin [Candidatus Sulfotelmatobacter sp.]
MRVRWLARALANLNAEAEYIASDNQQAAARMVQTVRQFVNLLRRYPALGRPGRVAGTRELVVSGTPYIIPYRVRNNEIQILRFFHGARKWPSKFR